MNDFNAALTSFIQDEVVLEDVLVENETDLLLSGAVDSLGVIRITHWIEEVTGMAVDPGVVTLENFQTVAKMTAFVDSRAGA